ncbi:fatty acid desaturase [Pseudomonas sp. NPDC090233]|uniref:fatty acid desaturase n=1 Tax=Pseudomonas sp. NPDC090233 TaxID=3364479 RepID=UPI00383AB205
MNNKDLLDESVRIRESYSALPLQAFWTWLTGKELRGRQPRWSTSPVECLIWSCIWLLGGFAASLLVVLEDYHPLWLIPSVIFTAGGARYIVATIIHHAVHHTLFASPLKNRILSEILSTITVVQPYDIYRQFHVFEHHGSDFSTTGDQDLAAIYRMGLTPGKTVAELKMILFLQCINPVFHLKFLFGRLKSNLIGPPLYRILMSVAWFGALTALAQTIGIEAFCLAVLLPLVLVYQVCSILHLVTEHVWVIRKAGETVKSSHVNNSLGRFCGEATPCGSSWVTLTPMWVLWTVRHLFWHLPCRILFVQGSLAVHDWHHRHGGKRNWPDSIQAREEEIIKHANAGEYSYTDIWGFANALEYTLSGISNSEEIIDLSNIRYRLN